MRVCSTKKDVLKISFKIKDVAVRVIKAKGNYNPPSYLVSQWVTEEAASMEMGCKEIEVVKEKLFLKWSFKKM